MFNNSYVLKLVITTKLKSPTKYNKKGIERLKPHENQKSLVDEQYLLSIQVLILYPIIINLIIIDIYIYILTI